MREMSNRQWVKTKHVEISCHEHSTPFDETTYDLHGSQLSIVSSEWDIGLVIIETLDTSSNYIGDLNKVSVTFDFCANTTGLNHPRIVYDTV